MGIRSNVQQKVECPEDIVSYSSRSSRRASIYTIFDGIARCGQSMARFIDEIGEILIGDVCYY